LGCHLPKSQANLHLVSRRGGPGRFEWPDGSSVPEARGCQLWIDDVLLCSRGFYRQYPGETKNGRDWSYQHVE